MSIVNLSRDTIIHQLTDQLSINTVKKDKFGEVFTPLPLVDKILDLFPKHVWSNPYLTWCDPCCGAGNFMVMVYYRLMNGLKQIPKLTHSSYRSNYIITQMLYMSDINPVNCKRCRKLFGVKSNISCKDFLTLESIGNTKTKIKKVTFDCIVGNPPFQKDSTTNNPHTGGNKLYEKILMKSLTMLPLHGYLGYIVPVNLFSGNNNSTYMHLINGEYEISFIDVSTSNNTYFPTIQYPICYFFLRKIETKLNKNNNKKTNIVGTNGITFTTVLTNTPFNPIMNWTKHTIRLVNKYTSQIPNGTVYNRGKALSNYSLTPTPTTKYTIIYTPDKMLYTSNIHLAIGHGTKKVVLFAISPDLNFKMDYTGKFGVGPNTIYIPFSSNKEGQCLERFFNSNDYRTLALSTRTSRQFLKLNLIKYLRLPCNIKKSVHTKKQGKLLLSKKTKKHK